jgi:galactose mutarotase-like enzyme
LDGHTAIINANDLAHTYGGWSPKQKQVVEGRINLNNPKTLKNLKAAKNSMIKQAGGMDFCYFLNPPNQSELNYAGRVRGRNTAIKVEVYTTKPLVYFYTANRFSNILGKKQTDTLSDLTKPINNFENVNSKKNVLYDKHSGFCLCPVTDNFKLENGSAYNHKSVYKFVVR